ncbi:MerR family transcriptional regulator [Roseateles violae]|uniref:MerR family transcriptional regulator n=1 Tax=Roseateles violae TaxID=3058042 RepID=A0ABT8DWC5_9BURK|nr:MerR family transcriptional regulator [Pelomonas sp. PFR6]MDN3922537.1 MerR family transcriptional regulator [Pelomonas sp. PFR6]
MKIGELAKHSGLAPSRIRFYEASGLIRGVERKENGYREYGPEALWTLDIITSAQSAGFSLDEIRNLLPNDQARWQHAELLGSLERKVAEIEVLQKRLEQNKAQLLVAIDSVKNRPDALACTDRAQWVLDKLKESSGPALAGQTAE